MLLFPFSDPSPGRETCPASPRRPLGNSGSGGLVREADGQVQTGRCNGAFRDALFLLDRKRQEIGNK